MQLIRVKRLFMLNIYLIKYWDKNGYRIATAKRIQRCIGIADSETKNPREFWSKLNRLAKQLFD